ncbi:MAG: methyltransferase domain-containing protein [Chloroflexi bacterium]|nr:methyltransferase domain-containing protein [Chloroflexota bacterium]
MQLYDFTEGLGSVYGRYVRNRYGEQLGDRYPIRSVLEAPCNAESYFASAGTQSVIFARRGGHVTVLHHDARVLDKTRDAWRALGLLDRLELVHSAAETLPFNDAQFDLVWNFDSIPTASNASRLITEMVRTARQLVWIIVPNRRNYGYPIHALACRLRGEPSPWGLRRWMDIAPIRRRLEALGCKTVDAGPIDAPPWPGFDVLNLIGRVARKKAGQRADGRTDAEIERALHRLTFIEYGRLPTAVKTCLAHQAYVLAEKPIG